MHVGKPLDVDAALAAGMMAQLVEQPLPILEARHQIQRDVCLPGRERDGHEFRLTAIRVPHLAPAEADDAGAPQLGLRPRGVLHHARDRAAVVADLLTANLVEERIHGSGGQLRLGLSHAPDASRSPTGGQPEP